MSQAVAVAVEREYPRKMFYRINEVSQITGIKPYVLRYWETEFPQLRPAKDSGDQRRYKPSDIDLVFEIKRLLYEEKFTIAGARKTLHNQSKPAEMAAQVVEIAPSGATFAADKIKRMRQMVESLRREINHLHNFI
ncbi:MAG: MerR family transcriptional regulator [Candidatus Sumerlaeota bacterium]|nr:MerR family transcriptional regulator [Candidatus Sumerlaeota bacterium]